MALLAIAGTFFSGVNLLNSLASTYRDLTSWDQEVLEVDNDWLPLAHSKGIVPGDLSEYEWMAERRVSTAELKGTAHAVVAYNDKKKIIYRLVRGGADDLGGRVVLVRKGP